MERILGRRPIVTSLSSTVNSGMGVSCFVHHKYSSISVFYPLALSWCECRLLGTFFLQLLKCALEFYSIPDLKQSRRQRAFPKWEKRRTLKLLLRHSCISLAELEPWRPPPHPPIFHSFLPFSMQLELLHLFNASPLHLRHLLPTVPALCTTTMSVTFGWCANTDTWARMERQELNRLWRHWV